MTRSSSGQTKPTNFRGTLLPFEIGDPPHLFKIDRGAGVELVFMSEDGRLVKAEDYMDTEGYN